MEQALVAAFESLLDILEPESALPGVAAVGVADGAFTLCQDGADPTAGGRNSPAWTGHFGRVAETARDPLRQPVAGDGPQVLLHVPGVERHRRLVGEREADTRHADG